MANFLIICCVVLIDVMIYSIAVPFFPGLLFSSTTLQFGEKEWMLIQSAANLSAALSGGITGWLSDTFGRKSVLIASQLVALGCSLFLTVGASFGFTILMIVGFVFRKSNRTFPICCSVSVDISDSAQVRKKRLGKLHGTFGLGFAAGPAIAGFLSKGIPAHACLGLGTVLAFLNILLVLAFVPQTNTSVNSTGKENEKTENENENENEKTENVNVNENEKESVHPSNSRRITFGEIFEKCQEPRLALVFGIQLAANFAQFCYITSISVAARERFQMDAATYGTLVSYFGLTYSMALFTTVPALNRAFGKDNSKGFLLFGLLLTAITRFSSAKCRDVPTLFLIHFFTSIGTAIVNLILSDAVAHVGKSVGLTGSLGGIQDTIHRASGVMSPILLAFLPKGLIESFLGDVFVGAFVSGVMYCFAAFLTQFAEIDVDVAEGDDQLEKDSDLKLKKE